jgi:hypothetical protein
MYRNLARTKYCRICCAAHHKSPSSMLPVDILQHRITEYRDCKHYEVCLGVAALADELMVPCVYCNKYPKF